jgi:hypothetical protein
MRRNSHGGALPVCNGKLAVVRPFIDYLVWSFVIGHSRMINDE